VEQKYYNLAVFALEKAKEVKVNVNKDLIFNPG
jgi:hypothetical protein